MPLKLISKQRGMQLAGVRFACNFKFLEIAATIPEMNASIQGVVIDWIRSAHFYIKSSGLYPGSHIP